MKRFYPFWFFICSGWGYLTTTFTPDMAPPISQFLATLALGALTATMLLALELWRGAKLSRPSLSLPPWDMPVGAMLFVLVTFLFSSLWGLLFAAISSNSMIEMPIHVFALSVGPLIGLWGCYRVFRSRFQA